MIDATLRFPSQPPTTMSLSPLPCVPTVLHHSRPAPMNAATAAAQDRIVLELRRF